jgi:HNH endonuclease
MILTKEAIDRFWLKVNKTSDCWEWTGSIFENGYGRLRDNEKRGCFVRAHRIAWIICNGAIPDNLKILHKCDNPICVRPSHLFLGTQKENLLDMTRKGRRRSNSNIGEKNPRAILTEKEVLEIRKDLKNNIKYKKLAKQYNVSISTINNIKRQKSWTHI